VKLSGGCLPRCAILSDRNEILAENFVCLAPDVLRGKRYSKASDVYSLGLLVFELTAGVKPFNHQRNCSLSKFIDTVDPTLMIQEDDAFSKLSTDVQNFIVTCVNASNEYSGVMESLAETLTNMKILPRTEL